MVEIRSFQGRSVRIVFVDAGKGRIFPVDISSFRHIRADDVHLQAEHLLRVERIASNRRRRRQGRGGGHG